MKLKPEFRKGSIFVKKLNTSVNLGVATEKELTMLKDAGIDYIFETETFEVKREYVSEPIEAETIEDFVEEIKKVKNKKK